MNILVTGSAGFIGFHTARTLLERGDTVIGIDNLNDYYDVSLKLARNEVLKQYDNYDFHKLDIADFDAVQTLFKTHSFDRVIHLAAQAGVRDSIDNPRNFTRNNIEGFLSILEGCRHYPVEHLVYASSSSVYGANQIKPSTVHHGADHPMALYGATKKANELMAHSYSNLYSLPTTGLRFFTVYGPWGRPDMALFMFTKNILEGKPINVFNYGKHKRDFTYVEDIVQGVIRTCDQPATSNADWNAEQPDPATSFCPYRVYNIGNNKPVLLTRYIELIEEYTGQTAEQNLLPMQPGDIEDSWADASDLMADVGYAPDTTVEVGVKRFVGWYLDYYQSDSIVSARAS